MEVYFDGFAQWICLCLPFSSCGFKSWAPHLSSPFSGLKDLMIQLIYCILLSWTNTHWFLFVRKVWKMRKGRNTWLKNGMVNLVTFQWRTPSLVFTLFELESNLWPLMYEATNWTTLLNVALPTILCLKWKSDFSKEIFRFVENVINIFGGILPTLISTKLSK